MKNIFLFLIFLLFASCANKEKQLVGHWHEYQIGNPDFVCCHNITDSTYTITMNVFDFITDSILKRGIDIPKNEVFTPQKKGAFGYDINDFFTSDFSVKENKVFIEDSIYWVKQKEDNATFISHFSMGLLINIHPFETNETKFDYNLNKISNLTFIHIGKLKNTPLSLTKKYNPKNYYLQLNDKISSISDIREFVLSESEETNASSQILLLINADKNVSKEFLLKLENEILNSGYAKNQIYYLTVNPEKRVYGYNHVINFIPK
ncbi:hypothetical protein FLAVO9AF_200019 [Flavobacterium sp. 9AF]|uniref:hypothetical protein n=1 Tax=Flavobacterium sp. 9AF TaxID=2653142 RepID=UPI0012F3C27F|nr:hypothetical protein [Flavobacterium sp. 9AF]VXB56821.1 hypothetical protein FLAVO9AF_200019 [Flavobacterium sp. 9AF]